jgi:hypothetical protein
VVVLFLTLLACSLFDGGSIGSSMDALTSAAGLSSSALRPAKRGCFEGDWTPDNHAELEVFVTPGDTAFDFTVPDVDGTDRRLSKLLANKPVAIFTGSYSCPVYRRARKKIDRIAKEYRDRLEVVIVHGPEAHPGKGEPSPYRGDSWPLKFSDRGLDTTFAERVKLAKAVGGAPGARLLVEPMDNPVWCSYGTVPNGAFLIDQDGTLVAVHDWFDAETFVASIDALLAQG